MFGGFAFGGLRFAVGVLRGWRFAGLGWRFAQLAVGVVGGWRGWRFAIGAMSFAF